MFQILYHTRSSLCITVSYKICCLLPNAAKNTAIIILFEYLGKCIGEDGLQALKDAVVRVRQGGAGFIVGHSLRSTDMVWLQSAGVNLDGLSVMDVAEVDKAFLPTHGIEFCGEPHVAGNDAGATALVIANLVYSNYSLSAI